MKKDEVRLKSIVWSPRYQAWGQTMKIRDYFVEMLFINRPRVWLHCEEIYYKVEDAEDGYKYN